MKAESDGNGGLKIRIPYSAILTVAVVIILQILGFWIQWKNSNASVISQVRTEFNEADKEIKSDVQDCKDELTVRKADSARIEAKLDDLIARMDRVQALLQQHILSGK